MKSLWESQQHRTFLESPLGDRCSTTSIWTLIFPARISSRQKKSQTPEDQLSSCWRSVPGTARPAWVSSTSHAATFPFCCSAQFHSQLIPTLHRPCTSFFTFTCILLKSHPIHVCGFLLEDIPETCYPSTKLIQRLTTVFRSLKTEKMPTVNELVTCVIMAYLEAETLSTPTVCNREKYPA